MPARYDHRFQLVLTPVEREAFAAAAERVGESLSAWIRRACRERALRDRTRDLDLLPPRRRTK